MLSRVADSLYWMSRYMERSDGILRMLKINYASSQDDLSKFSWKPVLTVFTYLEEDKAHAIEYDSRMVLQYMVADRENSNSVYNIVTKARENARSVQDHITKELWQCLNEFYHLVRDERLVEWLYKEDPVTVLDVLIRQCLLFYGTADITMARGEGNSFMDIGKFLERAIQSSDILDVKFRTINNNSDKTIDTTYWKYLLMSISGYELYLKSYRSGFNEKNVVEQVILNSHFPRSVLYSICEMHKHLDQFKNEGNDASYKRINFMMGKLKSKVQFSTVEAIMQQGLHKYLNEVIRELNAIGIALNESYFAYL